MWAYDFVQVRTHNGRPVRVLTIIDDYTRECLAIRARRSIRSSDVIETLAGLITDRGVPEQIRSDNVLTALSNGISSPWRRPGRSFLIHHAAIPAMPALVRGAPLTLVTGFRHWPYVN